MVEGDLEPDTEDAVGTMRQWESRQSFRVGGPETVDQSEGLHREPRHVHRSYRVPGLNSKPSLILTPTKFACHLDCRS